MPAGIRPHHWSFNGIVNNALFHSGQHVNQTLIQIIHILHFCLLDSLLTYAITTQTYLTGLRS